MWQWTSCEKTKKSYIYGYFPKKLRNNFPEILRKFLRQFEIIKSYLKFFFNFRKILDFFVIILKKLLENFELILKKFWKTSKETAEKLCKNLMKFGIQLGKFLNDSLGTLKKC